MQAPSQLCDRAMSLDGAGSSAKAAPRRSLPSTCSRASDPARGGVARSRHGARWRARPPAVGASRPGPRGERRSRRSEAVGIEIRFRVLGHGDAVFPKIKVYDSRWNVAFNAMDTSERWLEPSAPGEYVTTRGSRELPQRGAHDRRRLNQRRLVPRSCCRMRADARPSPSTSRIRRRVTPRAGCSPGSGRESSARCSNGRPRRASKRSLGGRGRAVVRRRCRRHLARLASDDESGVDAR